MIRSIDWTDQGVVMLDQRRLPAEEVFKTCRTPEEIAEAIVAMVIRGAPAIGVAAAMGIALGMEKVSAQEELEREFERLCRLFEATRPTARNLFWAMERMRQVFSEHREDSTETVRRALKEEALNIYREDIEVNRRIGQFGQQLLDETAAVLTHCNTGALATAGYGTALGIVRAAVEKGKTIQVFADETRPFLQGARLTAWELGKENIPCTLITDNMAGHFMQMGQISAVIVGADRIARNGDVANKIGTYILAVLAREHGIPFYVAAPLSTIDLATASGSEIPIEQRDPSEVTEVFGRKLAPEGARAANPAFDVTPGRLVSAIVTDAGIAKAPYEESIPALFDAGSQRASPDRGNEA